MNLLSEPPVRPSGSISEPGHVVVEEKSLEQGQAEIAIQFKKSPLAQELFNTLFEQWERTEGRNTANRTIDRFQLGKQVADVVRALFDDIRDERGRPISNDLRIQLGGSRLAEISVQFKFKKRDWLSILENLKAHKGANTPEGKQFYLTVLDGWAQSLGKRIALNHHILGKYEKDSLISDLRRDSQLFIGPDSINPKKALPAVMARRLEQGKNDGSINAEEADLVRAGKLSINDLEAVLLRSRALVETSILHDEKELQEVRRIIASETN